MPDKRSTIVAVMSAVMTAVLAAILLAAPMGQARGAAAAADPNPYLWLTQIHGKKALTWVEAQNGRSDLALEGDATYARDRSQIMDVLNANTRIPRGELDHGWVLNFWQSAAHVRGIWRRARIADYARKAPRWQTLLDVDQLDSRMHQNWVWHGADCTAAFDRCLVRLSPGGGDAAEIREYDPRTRSFVAGGFEVPVAKGGAMYLNPDTVLVATDFGPGTMTPSSYPRIVKLWRRGEPLASAKTLFEGRPDDMSVTPYVFRGPYGSVAVIERRPSFFEADYYVVGADGTTRRIPVPQDAQIEGVTQGQLILTLQNAWTVDGRTIGKGALVAFPVMAFERTGGTQPVSVLYTPGPHAMIDEVSTGRDAVYASVYEDVTGSIREFRPGRPDWSDMRLALPRGGSTSIVSTNDWGPQAYFSFESFLEPPSLYAYGGSGSPTLIKAQPTVFDGRDMSVSQYWASSHDGTKVPYFLIRPRKAQGAIPTILYGYGGFQLSLTPWYWNDGHKPLDAGETWLSHGGAIAVANIRGGGEFGPAWHQAALKYHRQRAYDDFEAVAADIERRNLSTPKQLGIVGASNGGLLVSTVMVERPDLFGAVVCQRPLIDMLRYTHYGAGASWVGEYGDPADPKMAAYIRTYSPFQNVKQGVAYPPILFIAETTDDRVTPVFARMMAAKMEAQGHDVLFNEATEGGHGPGATHAEEAQYWALAYTFFAKRLGLGR
ncbi:MAG TPA: prolyl oligopeptidase family serine peptidase [Steroidobacteraceae bacterium]|nr:prolyl oligopeptidase family serine peptidase [Steroidobacteraceae bacterium]